MPARLTTLLLVFLLFAPLSGCGQKGGLYIPPTCSPVRADGTILQRMDEDGNVLPPCPPAETDEEPGAETESEAEPLDENEPLVEDTDG